MTNVSPVQISPIVRRPTVAGEGLDRVFVAFVMPVNAWLLASAVLTFFGIRRLYSSSIRVVQAGARRSESIFLWLYFNRICAIQDRQSGELTAY
jgi:hypothetical protein